ncbi:hypothetical protein HDV04_005772 [Boothiomyces sp. JEL0838]|nr:hypothetical protein HDV04_005772 [Boothiomyces sp. JEL0838]
MISFTTKFQKESLQIDLPDDAVFTDLTSKFNPDPSLVKILHSGKQIHQLPQPSNSPYKIIVLVTSNHQVDTLHQKEEFAHQALKNYNNALLSRPKYNIVKQGYFKHIEPLELHEKENARELLFKLRDDPSIKQIMYEREWRVTRLIELHPDEKTILGYNQNKGQVVALRLRTDNLDGFRYYNSIVKVLLHELAHMIFSEHDEHFHRLDRELNRDYERYKGRRLDGSTGSVVSVESTVNVLGGKKQEGELRDILFQAATSRLTKEEQEIQDGCGSK